MKLPSLFMVPPMTSSPVFFETGTLSPVIMLSSTLLAPSTMTPSRGTRSPGLTRRMSIGMMVSTPTSSSEPSSLTIRAMGGWRSSSFRTASEARPLATSSRYLPIRMRASIRAEASK